MPTREIPLMAPLIHEFRCYILGSGPLREHSLPRTLESFASLWLEESTSEQLLALRPMAVMGPKAYARSSVEGNNRRFRRHPSMGNSKKVEAEGNHGGGREMSLGERRFTMETSLVERLALFRLEKELEATLLFEHGGDYRANPLWVTQILLGRLFHERLSLGRAIKSFAKFQCREMMRGLLKLDDLEDVAEPPLGGNQELSVSRMPRDKPMDMEAEDAVLEEAKEDA